MGGGTALSLPVRALGCSRAAPVGDRADGLAQSAGFLLRHHDAVLGCLREAGSRSGGGALDRSTPICTGFLVQEPSLPFSDAGPPTSRGRSSQPPPGTCRTCTVMQPESASAPGYSFGGEFRFGTRTHHRRTRTAPGGPGSSRRKIQEYRLRAHSSRFVKQCNLPNTAGGHDG